MQKITKQEFEAIASQAYTHWRMAPMWEKSGRGWYQHGELLGIVLEMEHNDTWCFAALRKNHVGEYSTFVFTTSLDDLLTYEAAEAELKKALTRGPHPFEADLRALIAKHAWQATEDDLVFFGEALEDASEEVNLISEKRFPHDDEEE